MPVGRALSTPTWPVTIKAIQPLSPENPHCVKRVPRKQWTGWACILVVGIALRSIAIGHTPALTDEAFTFWRVCGTLGQMLDALRPDAFVPLHYEIVWLLTKLLGSDVWVMRLPAAAAGVVMPIAVGRLARVLFGYRAALPAALLTLGSAYFAFHARNAKMYQPAWLMLTLATTSVLAYARSRRRRTLLTFIFFGTFAGCLQSLMLLPLALSPVLAAVWARRKIGRTFLLTTLATAIVTAGPVTYYATCSRWFTEAGGLSGAVDGQAAPHKNGLDWIEQWQSGRSPVNVLLQCATSYLTGVEWPEAVESFWEPPGTPGGLTFDLTVTALALAGGTFLVCTAMLICSGRPGGERPRRLVALTLLLAVPCYGFYLRSFHDLAPPWRFGWIGWLVASVALLTLFGSGTKRALLGIGSAAGLLVLLWAGGKCAYAFAQRDAAGNVIWPPLWMPRYAAFIAPPLLATLGGAIAHLPAAWLRWLVLGPLVAINLTLTLLPQWYDTQPPWPAICADVAAAQSDHSTAVAVTWGSPGHAFGHLPSPYFELARAIQLDVDPDGFRAGNEWPFRPGKTMRSAVDGLRVYRVETAVADDAAKTIIVWTRDDEPPTLPGWYLSENKSIRWYYTSNWSVGSEYTRAAYLRITPATASAIR